MIKSVIGGAAPAVSAGPADDAWSDGQPLDLGGFEVGPVLAGELTQMRLVEDLWRLDPQSSLQLLRYSGGREFPPAWRPVLDQARGVARRDVRVVQEKPFWGQLEYYETDSLLENALRFLSADGNRPDTVSTGTDAAASPVLKPQ
jgi:hypothetical protein